MNDSTPRHSIAAESRSLARYRPLLVIGVLANFILVARIPYSQIRAESANNRSKVAQTKADEATFDARLKTRADAPTSGKPALRDPNSGLTAAVPGDRAKRPHEDEIIIFAISRPTTRRVPNRPGATPELPAEPAAKNATASHRDKDTAPSTAARKSDADTDRLPRDIRRKTRQFMEKLEQQFALRSVPGFSQTGSFSWATVLKILEQPHRVQPPDGKHNHGDLADSQLSSANPARTQASPATPKTARPDALILANPEENGGPVHYLLDGVVQTLNPGEKRVLVAGQTHRIRFDRGGGFGTQDLTVAKGVYHFSVSEQGWSLGRETNATEY